MPTLSEDFIKKVDPPEKGRRLVFDDHKDAPRGFGLRVTAAGAKAFVLRYRSKEGKDRLLTIGEWGTWTLAAARKEASNQRQAVDRGTDILESRREARAALTVADVVDRYCRARVDNLASGESVRALLQNHLASALGKKKISSIGRRDVIAVIEELAAKRPRQAGKLLTYVKLLFAYAEDREIIDGNPVATLKATKIGARLTSRSRARVLDSDEIRALWASAEGCGIHRLTGLALKLILITGQRPGEVVGMHRDEVSGAIWTIPAERRRKTDSAHTVPLTSTALALLDAAKAEVERLSRRKKRTGGFVFEARPGGPLTVHGLDRAVKRYAEALGNRDTETWGHWRPHDLRRTARTGMAAAGVGETVAELTIGHTRKGIAAVYDLHRYDREKRAALEAWERQLLGFAESNVVPITGAFR
jgi:integrase